MKTLNRNEAERKDEKQAWHTRDSSWRGSKSVALRQDPAQGAPSHFGCHPPKRLEETSRRRQRSDSDGISQVPDRVPSKAQIYFTWKIYNFPFNSRPSEVQRSTGQKSAKMVSRNKREREPATCNACWESKSAVNKLTYKPLKCMLFVPPINMRLSSQLRFEYSLPSGSTESQESNII